MYILIIFIILSSIQFIFIWMKWQDIKDYQSMADDFADFTTLSKSTNYQKILKFLGKILFYFKKILLIPFIVLLLINFIISSFIGGILYLVF